MDIISSYRPLQGMEFLAIEGFKTGHSCTMQPALERDDGGGSSEQKTSSIMCHRTKQEV